MRRIRGSRDESIDEVRTRPGGGPPGRPLRRRLVDHRPGCSCRPRARRSRAPSKPRRASGPVAALKVSVVGQQPRHEHRRLRCSPSSGVPAGQVTLRFEGPGIDARLDLSGPRRRADHERSRQRLRFAGVRLSPSPHARAPVARPRARRTSLALRGRIDSISGSSPPGARQAVVTDGSTRIRRSGETIPFSDLKVGQTVEVEGQAQANGSILAKSITVEDDNARDESRSEPSWGPSTRSAVDACRSRAGPS